MLTTKTQDDVMMQARPYWEKLTAFDSAVEIKDFLVSEKIVGVPAHANRCAIAAYVHRGSGQPTHVGSGMIEIMAWGIRFEHTEAMKQFVKDFDDGAYPELVQPNWLSECLASPAGTGATYYNDLLEGANWLSECLASPASSDATYYNDLLEGATC